MKTWRQTDQDDWQADDLADFAEDESRRTGTKMDSCLFTLMFVVTLLYYFFPVATPQTRRPPRSLGGMGVLGTETDVHEPRRHDLPRPRELRERSPI